MNFDKLLIHQVALWRLAGMVIVSSTDYPELGFLVWAGGDHQGTGELSILVPGLKKRLELHSVKGDSSPWLEGTKWYGGPWPADELGALIDMFVVAIRACCRTYGIKKLVFEGFESFDIIQEKNDLLLIDMPCKDNVDILRFEKAFYELRTIYGGLPNMDIEP